MIVEKRELNHQFREIIGGRDNFTSPIIFWKFQLSSFFLSKIFIVNFWPIFVYGGQIIAPPVLPENTVIFPILGQNSNKEQTFSGVLNLI